MIPMINKPTRVTRQHAATAIDHVFTDTIMDNIEIKTYCQDRHVGPFSYHLCYKKTK